LAPRTLALVGVELLAARSTAVRERISQRQSGARSITGTLPAPPPAPPRSVAPAPNSRDVRVRAAGVWRAFVAQDGGSAWGGRLQASATAMKRGVVTGDLELAGARKEIDSVGEATALLLSTAGSFGLRAGGDRWRGAIGVGGRIGLVRESGRSADPARISTSTFVRPWGGPMLSGNLSAARGRLALSLGVEAGWSLSSIDEVAGAVTAMTVRGAWLALSLGAELRVR